MHPTPCLGIDMAQASFVAGLWFDDRRILTAEFSNNPAGFAQLLRWLKRHGVRTLRVGIESTNTYGFALARWLHDRGFCVYILNPERTACYSRVRGQRNKTDPADARSIASFVAKEELTRWMPPSAEQQTLQELTRLRHQLVETCKRLMNQRRTAGPTAAAHLQPLIDALREQLKAIAAHIKRHLQEHPHLGEQVRRLMTLKGIGLITAAVVLAELPPIGPDTDPRAVCAWCGLIPQRWQSGQTELPSRLSKKGNSYLRQALFMPALVAKRHNPFLRCFAQRLLANGKRPSAVIGALSHKMLRILVGLLKHNRDFDPNWAFSKT